jgi:long-chain acyl-CoA synthetase
MHVVPINWHLAPAEVAHILDDSGSRTLVVHERLAPLVKAAVAAMAHPPELLICIGRLAGCLSLEDFIEAGDASAPEDTCVGRMLTYTSATTGTSKGIRLPLENAAAALQRSIGFRIAVGVHPEGGHVHLCASMLYHAAPLEGAIVSLHMGHAVVLVGKWDAEILLQLIQEHRVTTSFMVPTMFIRLLKLPPRVRERYDVRSSLRFVLHSAAPCPVETKRQMIEWWGPILWEGYGAAEGAGTVVDSHDWLKYPGTVGKPIPGSRIRILDDEGEEQPCGTSGTIYLTRYTGDRFEYRGAPEKTRAAHRGEFFTAGDVGYLNEEGYLFICDRKIDMIITGGMNIYSAEIERILVQHPRVADCAVFGIPDQLMGEVVNAVVQPLPNVTPDAHLTADILKFIAAHLSSVKVPRRLEYASELPRDPNGKLYKQRLRAPYWRPLGRRI